MPNVVMPAQLKTNGRKDKLGNTRKTLAGYRYATQKRSDYATKAGAWYFAHGMEAEAKECYKIADDLNKCGAVQLYELDETGEQIQPGGSHISFLCRNRLCPNCAHQKSLKMANDTTLAIERLQKTYKERGLRTEVLMLTLTVENCWPSVYVEYRKFLFKAVSNLRRRPEFKKLVIGGVKQFETTFSKEDGRMHPHFHLLLIVHRNDAHKQGRNYVTHEQWVDLWEDVLGEEYQEKYNNQEKHPKPSVEIHRLEDFSNGKYPLRNMVSEVCKYVTKDAEFDESSLGYGRFLALVKGTKRARTHEFFGVLYNFYKQVEEEKEEKKKELTELDKMLIRLSVLSQRFKFEKSKMIREELSEKIIELETTLLLDKGVSFETVRKAEEEPGGKIKTFARFTWSRRTKSYHPDGVRIISSFELLNDMQNLWRDEHVHYESFNSLPLELVAGDEIIFEY